MLLGIDNDSPLRRCSPSGRSIGPIDNCRNAHNHISSTGWVGHSLLASWSVSLSSKLIEKTKIREECGWNLPFSSTEHPCFGRIVAQCSVNLLKIAMLQRKAD